MKYLVLALLMLLSGGPGWRWLSRVRERNEALARAQAAYREGNPAGAAAAFGRALAIPTPRPVPDPRLLLNLAHAQAQAGQAAARASYGQLLSAARVPARLGSVARQQLAVLTAGQGQYAQALGLLRQALLLDPANAGARYDYEVLREFMTRQPAPDGKPPKIPTPPPTAKPPAAGKSPAPAPQNQAPAPAPTPRPGADRPGQLPDPAWPGPPSSPPRPRPAAPGPTRPDPAPGTSAGGASRPGAGPARPLPTGPAAGAQRGLGTDAPGARPPAGAGSQPGAEQATDADQQLQTQRERLRQLNLTPAQARQLLEALRAQEAQYLQQRARPAGRRPRPDDPTW